MELILIIILFLTQMNGKNGKPALELSKLTPLFVHAGR